MAPQDPDHPGRRRGQIPLQLGRDTQGRHAPPRSAAGKDTRRTPQQDLRTRSAAGKDTRRPPQQDLRTRSAAGKDTRRPPQQDLRKVGHTGKQKEGNQPRAQHCCAHGCPQVPPREFLPPKPGSVSPEAGSPGLRGPQTHHSLHPNTQLQKTDSNWSRQLSGSD